MNLRPPGIRLCLDDFGSGYANLNTVMKLPFSTIKLDRSLLFDICKDEKTGHCSIRVLWRPFRG